MSCSWPRAFLLGLFCLLTALPSAAAGASSRTVFERRILLLFRSQMPLTGYRNMTVVKAPSPLARK